VHAGEYYALILMAVTGMMFLVSSEDILMIFLSLELTSLSLYILTAFNKQSDKSAEAALKYFLFGGMSAAFTLFGLSLLYGFLGAEGNATWHDYMPGWVPMLAIIALFSMLLGNLAALVQSSVRRLLAYSAVAHGGYMLLAIIAGNRQGLAPLVYYVLTYGLTT